MSTKAKHLSPEARDVVVNVIERFEQNHADFYVCMALRGDREPPAFANTEAVAAFTRAFKPRTYEELLVTRTPEMIEYYCETGIMPHAWLSAFSLDDTNSQQASFDHRLLALHLFLVLDENGDLP